MKTIVTHLSPDLDAIAACWLIKKYLPGWRHALIKLVPAGETLNKMIPDSGPEIIHVDTGLGKFDHHQTSKFISASHLVFNFLINKKYINKKDFAALERLVKLITEFDHFQEYFYPNPTEDRYTVMIQEIVEGLKPVLNDDNKLVERSFDLLEAALYLLKNKVSAEQEIQKGYPTKSKWGKTLILITANSSVSKLAEKMGYNLVVIKDPKKGNVRIKSPPIKKIDLTELYNKIVQEDPKATWYFHPSKRILINGTAHNPDMIPSSLSISKLIEIINKI